MRKFRLTNGSGTVLDLNVKGGTFLSSPSGLGLSKTQSFVQIGNSFVLTDNRVNQGEISCDMVFATYQQYRDFVNFCQADTLNFWYQTPIDQTYWKRSVVLASCEKTEIGDKNALVCPVKFACIDNWYKETYIEKLTPSTAIYYNLTNNSNLDAGIRLSFIAGAAQTQITGIWHGLTSETAEAIGDPFGTNKINVGDKVVLKTIDGEAALTYVVNNSVYNDFSYAASYTKNIYFKVPPGNYYMSITASQPITSTLTIREEYLSV